MGVGQVLLRTVRVLPTAAEPRCQGVAPVLLQATLGVPKGRREPPQLRFGKLHGAKGSDEQELRRVLFSYPLLFPVIDFTLATLVL